MQRRFLQKFMPALAVLLCCAATAWSEPNQLESVILTPTQKNFIVILESGRKAAFYTSQGDSPPQITIHFTQDLFSSRGPVEYIGKGALKAIHYNYEQSQREWQGQKNLSSIVLELSEAVDAQIEQKGWTIAVTLQPPRNPVVDSAAQPNPAPLEPAPATPTPVAAEPQAEAPAPQNDFPLISELAPAAAAAPAIAIEPPPAPAVAVPTAPPIAAVVAKEPTAAPLAPATQTKAAPSPSGAPSAVYGTALPAATSVEQVASSETFSVGAIGAEDFIEHPRKNLGPNPQPQDFVQVALANHVPLDIAQKELLLANKKVFEAHRTFFPAVGGKYSESKGTIRTDPTNPNTFANFNRKEVGVEVGQPIFQSGRIFYGAKQALAQRDAGALNVDKVIHDITYDTLQALYAYLQRKETLIIRQKLLERTRKVVDTAGKKRDLGVVSESDYLGALANGTQIEYRAASEEKDEEIAKSTLLAVLKINELPDVIPISIGQLAGQALVLKDSIEKYMQKAFANRPEIRAAHYGLRASRYARKVARAENLMKVDASAFFGQSGAAFETETLTLRDSYNVGVKAVLYFGGNSISPFASKEKTAPDLGSTSRTETEAKTISVNLLDSLAGKSNVLASQIDEQKAWENFQKTRRDVALEVKEAFFNYQKARLQLESARKELNFRTKESAIIEAKDRLNQVEPGQVLQSIANKADAEANQKEAEAFLLTSLAALEKATGAPLTQ